MSKQANILPFFLSFFSLLLSIAIAFPAFSIHKKDIDIGNHPSSKLEQFTSEGHVLAFDNTSMRVVGLNRALTVEFVNANNVKHYSSSNKKPVKGKSNTEFENITYPNLWDGIDLYYDKGEGIVRSTYTVSAGSKVEDIKLQYNQAFNLLDNGSLQFVFDNGSWTESPPIAWQDINGKRNPVTVDFKKVADNQIGFLVGEYDKEYPLVIDPTLSWHTFLGAGADNPAAIAIDSSGNIYLVGASGSNTDWNLDISPLNSPSNSNQQDIYVAKLDNNGDLIWYTFYGSETVDTWSSHAATGVVVDDNDDIYITGFSGDTWGSSPRNSHSRTRLSIGSNADLMVAKINSDGDLLWNSFYGAGQSETASSLVLDDLGNIYIVGIGDGESWGSPWGAPENIVPDGGAGDMLLVKLDNTGAFQWYTFYGTHKEDQANDIALDNGGNVYITGSSLLTWGNPINNFTAPLPTNNSLTSDIVIIKTDPYGQHQWHGFWGSPENDTGHAIAIDSSNNIYVKGVSEDNWGNPINNYPTFPGIGDGDAAVIFKLNSNENLEWNTFFPRIYNSVFISQFSKGITFNDEGEIFFAINSTLGWGQPTDSFPIPDPSIVRSIGIGALNSDGHLISNTFIGSSYDQGVNDLAIDNENNVYITGLQNRTQYSPPTDENLNWGDPINPSNASSNIIAAKLAGFLPLAPISNAGSDQSVEFGELVTLDGSASSDANGDPLTYFWSFTNVPTGSLTALGDVTSVNPTFTPDVSGVYTISLVVNDGTESSVADTVDITVAMALDPVVAIDPSGRIVTGTTGAENLYGGNGDDVIASNGASLGVENISGRGGADRLTFSTFSGLVQDNADQLNGHVHIRDFIIDNIDLYPQSDSISLGRLLGVSNLDANTIGDYLHVVSNLYGIADQGGIFINLDGDYDTLDRLALDSGAGLVGGNGSDLLLTFGAEQGNNNFEMLTGHADNTVAQFQALIDMGFLELSTTDIYGSSGGDTLEGTTANERIFSAGSINAGDSIRGNGGADSLVFEAGDFLSTNVVGPNAEGHFRIRDFIIDDIQNSAEADTLAIGNLIGQPNLDATSAADYFHIISGLFGTNRASLLVNLDGNYSAADRQALDADPSAGRGTDLFLEFQGLTANNNLEVLTGYADNTVDQLQVLIDWGFLDLSITPKDSFCQPGQAVVAPAVSGVTITGTPLADDIYGSHGNDDIFSGGLASDGVESIRGQGGADRLIFLAGDNVAQDIADDSNGHLRIRDFVIDNTYLNPEADSISLGSLLGISNLDATSIAPHIHIISHLYGWGANRGAIFVNLEGDFTLADREALDTGLGHDGGYGADLLLEFQGFQGNNNFNDLTGHPDNSAEQLEALFNMGFFEPSNVANAAYCQ